MYGTVRTVVWEDGLGDWASYPMCARHGVERHGWRSQLGCVRTESKFLEKNHSEILELSDPQPQFYEVVINNSLNIAVFLK